MNESELVSALIATHHYPAKAEQLAGLALMYSAFRADVESMGAVLGTGDLAPALRFTACRGPIIQDDE
jgi:hypothetical protein